MSRPESENVTGQHRDTVAEKYCRISFLDAVRLSGSQPRDQYISMSEDDTKLSADTFLKLEQFDETLIVYAREVGDAGFENLQYAVESAVETADLESFLKMCLYAERETHGEHVLECLLEKAIKDGKHDFVLTFCVHHENYVEDAAEQFRLFDRRFRIAGKLAIQMGCWEFAREVLTTRYPCIPWLSILLSETYCLESSSSWPSLAPLLEDWLKQIPLSVLKEDMQKASQDAERQGGTLAVLSQWCVTNCFPSLALVLSLMQNDWPAVEAAADKADAAFLKKSIDAALRVTLPGKSWSSVAALLKHAPVDDVAFRRLIGPRMGSVSEPQQLLAECRQAGVHKWAAFLVQTYPVIARESG
nr:hypothetical protein BaRGS_002063 [Batillaria attramentaria]